MKTVKAIFDFYLNASIHVALAVYALSWITLREFGLPYDEAVLYFIFYASVTGYNFVKYFGTAKFHHRRLTNWLKVIQLFSAFCFVLLSYYAFQLNNETLLILMGFGVITFFYAMPFFPKKFLKHTSYNLRNISGFKIYVIGLVWAGVTVCIPLVNGNYPLKTMDVILTTVQRFIFVIVLMLPFEIRDLQYDSITLETIPQRIGVKRTKILGVLLLILFLVLEFFKDTITLGGIANYFIIAIITLLFLYVSKEKQSKYYTAFWVESIPIIWLVLQLAFG